MSDRKKYRAWEIFWHGGVVYQCVPDSNGDGYCNNCEMEMWCDYKPYACCSFERSDNTCVHYVKVTEPKEGMLFRASDGVLYELKKLVGGCGCYLYGYIGCDYIDYEAFGKNVLGGFHWYPVKENKQEKSNMEETKRHLELAVVKVDGDQVTFKIVKQTHRGEKLTPNGNKFLSRSGYIILTDKWPEYRNRDKHLFVCGSNSNDDHTLLTVEIENFAKIMEAVTEYNETDGKGYEKTWPQNGDKYYFIDSDSVILEWNYTHNCTDEMRSSFGNLFRTREEANAALERVKKALKG